MDLVAKTSFPFLVESSPVALEKHLGKTNEPKKQTLNEAKQYPFGELLLCPMVHFRNCFIAPSLHAASSICCCHTEAAADDL